MLEFGEIVKGSHGIMINLGKTEQDKPRPTGCLPFSRGRDGGFCYSVIPKQLVLEALLFNGAHPCSSMELTLTHLSSFPALTRTSRDSMSRVWNAQGFPSGYSSIDMTIQNLKSRRPSIVPCALVETAASVAVAAAVVGAAATLLVNRNKAASEANEIPLITCEDCGGSGICPECKCEGFVLKRLSDESADKARKSAKNMATRYTAGLPKKWSYCTKCSSSRSCTTCEGRGKLSY
ncbi:unnamed protein product [Linum trigynum]|uniref:DUF7895 domain-containing protein n=1 Tax=Linum trigynum TaxID=586398 RepID=A0AAV2G342_9ROSI